MKRTRWTYGALLALLAALALSCDQVSGVPASAQNSAEAGTGTEAGTETETETEVPDME